MRLRQTQEPMAAHRFYPRVEVRWLDLDRHQAQLESAMAVLSDDECERAARYRFGRDRRRYVLVRAALRRQLAAYLNLAPTKLRFEYNHAGKPRLAADCGEAKISFNVSHSADLGLLAFGFGCRVGADIEYMKIDLEFRSLARHSFSACEQRQLRTLEEGPGLTAGFYRCWTRKEAYIKALGDGIGYGLDRFDVSLDAAELRLLADRNTDRELQWKYSELSFRPDYAAVVVADALDYQLHTEELRMQSVFTQSNSSIG